MLLSEDALLRPARPHRDSFARSIDHQLVSQTYHTLSNDLPIFCMPGSLRLEIPMLAAVLAALPSTLLAMTRKASPAYSYGVALMRGEWFSPESISIDCI